MSGSWLHSFPSLHQLVSMGPTHLELSVSSQSSSECSRNVSFLASTSIFSECSERGVEVNGGMNKRGMQAETFGTKENRDEFAVSRSVKYEPHQEDATVHH